MRSTGLGKAILGLNFSDTLREAYRKDNILPVLIDHEKLPIHYVNEHYVSLEVLTDGDQSAELVQAASVIIEPQGIFDRIDSKNKTWILLLGDAGTGKTTLLHYLAHMWGSESLKSQTIQYVFRVRLRRLIAENWNKWLSSKASHRLAEHPDYEFARFLEFCLIKDQKQPVKNLFENIFKRLTQKPKNSFLFLLDGYDEVSHLDSEGSGSLVHAFINKIKTFPKVILTSRPNAIASTLTSEFNVKLKNIGFTKAHIKEYINNYFGDDKLVIQSLWQFLEVNQSIKDLCYTPINLTLVCLIWSDELSQTNIRLSDGKLSVLYQEIILWMCRRYLDKVEGVPALKIADKTPERLLVHPVVTFLKKLAFDTINNAQELIGNTLINNLLLSHEEAITKEFIHPAIEKLEAIRAVNKFGVLKAEGTQRDLTKVSHEFIHKTFKEWLCASYLKDGLLGTPLFKDGIAFDVVDYIAEHGGDASHFMVMKFLSGLIIETDNHEAIVKFWEAIWSSQTSNEERIMVPGEKSVLLLMQLLSQAVLNGGLHPSVPKYIIEFVDSTLWEDLPRWEKALTESRYLSAEVVGKLLNELDSNKGDCHTRTLNTLAHLNISSRQKDRAIVLILSKTKSDDENIVEASVYALYAMVHEPGVMDLMYKILDEGSERAVIIAMELLSQIGGSEVANRIIKKLGDHNLNIKLSVLIRICEMVSNQPACLEAVKASITTELKILLWSSSENELASVLIVNTITKLELLHPVVERYMDDKLARNEGRFSSAMLDPGVLGWESELEAGVLGWESDLEAGEHFITGDYYIPLELKTLLLSNNESGLKFARVKVNRFINNLGMMHPIVEKYIDDQLGRSEGRFNFVIVDTGVLGRKNTLETTFAELDSATADFYVSFLEQRKIVKFTKEIVRMDIKLSVHQAVSLVSALLEILQHCHDNKCNKFLALMVSSYVKIDQLYTEEACDYLLGFFKSKCPGLIRRAIWVFNFIHDKLPEQLANKLLQDVPDWVRDNLRQKKYIGIARPKQLFDSIASGCKLEEPELRRAAACLFALLVAANWVLPLCPEIINKCITKAVKDLVQLLFDENRIAIEPLGGIGSKELRENYIKNISHSLFCLWDEEDREVKARTSFAIGLWVKKVPMQITELLIKLSECRTNEDFSFESILILDSIYDEIPKSAIPSLIKKLLPLLWDQGITYRNLAAYLISMLKHRWDVTSPAVGSDVSVKTIIDWLRGMGQLSEPVYIEYDEKICTVEFFKASDRVERLLHFAEYYFNQLYSRNDFIRECSFLSLAKKDRSFMDASVITAAIKSSGFFGNDENRNELLALIERRKNGESMSSILEPLKALSERLRNPNARVVQKVLRGLHLLIIENNQVNKDALLEFAQWIQKEKLDCRITLSSIEVGGHDLSKSTGYFAVTLALRIQFAQLLSGELKLASLDHAIASHGCKAFSLLDKTMPLGPHAWRVSVLKSSAQAVMVTLEQAILSHVVVKKLSLEGSVSSERIVIVPLMSVTKAFRAEVFGSLDATTVGLAYEVAAMTLSNEEANDLMALFQSLDVDQILQSLKTLPSETERCDQKRYSVNLLMHRDLLGMSYEDGIRSLEERLTVMGARVTAIGNELEALKTIMLEKASQLDQLLNHHQASINVIEARIQSQSEIINFVGLDVAAVHENMQQFATEVNKVKHVTEDIRVQGSTLTFTMVNSHYQEVEALKDKMEKQQSVIERLTTILDTHTADIACVNELLKENAHDAEFNKRIIGNIYQETLYHNLVKQLHNVGLASSMVQTGIFASAQTGKIGKVGQLFSMFSSSIPLIGIGAKICGTILKAVDSHWQKKMLERFSNLGTITEMNQLFKLTAQSLVQEPTELDEDLLNKPKSLADKIYGILSAASEAIMDVAELPLMVMDSAVHEFESLHEAVEQETEQGEKHAALIISVITAHVYRGDAECVANATSSMEEKCEILRGFVLRSYGMIRGSAENFARELLGRVKANLSVQIAFSNKEKHLKREEKFVVVFSDRLLKTGCESLLKEPETREQTLNHLVEKLSQVDRCRIFKTTASEKKLAVHEDIDREVKGFKTANYLSFTAQIETLIKGAGNK